MATVDKAFKIKNGLIVEGSTATVNGSNVLTEASTEFLQDTTAAMFTNGTHTDISFTYNDVTGTIDAAVSTSPTFGDKITFEGSVPDSYETILQVSEPTQDNTITLPNVSGTVVTTGDTGTVSNTMLANSAITINGVSTSLGGTRTLVTDDIAEDGSPTNLWFTDERAQDAVAAAIAAGTQTNITITYDDTLGSLSFNASGGVSSLTGTANEIEVSASTGAVTIGLPNDITVAGNITINGTPSSDSHAVTKGYVDAIAQGLHIHASCVTATTSNIDLSTDLEAGDIIDGVTLVAGNRVLVKNQSTTSQNGIYLAVTSGAAVRASDFDTSAEIQGGDFVFVTGGSVNNDTGWVQTEKVTTVGSDPIVFTQFSGAGTYQAGNGLSLLGNVFSINTAITADLSSVQSLTNKTLTSPTITNPTVSGLYLSDNNIVIEGTADTYETTLTFTNPTDDRTITFKDESGTVAYTADVESAVDAFGNAVTGGTGISTSYATTSNILTITNVGVTGLTGTADQVTVSASTGSVTLSLPQSIATTSSPTFAGLSVGSGSLTAGSVTLTDALLGTATTSVTTTSATVVDSWSASSYRSAKYLVQMIKNNDIEVIEVLVTVDGNNNVYLTEYADVQSNIQLGTTDADYSGGNVRLLVTSTNGTTVKVHKTLIEA